MTPSVPLTGGVVVVITLVAVCLLLKGYSPVCSATVGEQADNPFKPVQNVERYIPQFLHLFSVRSLVVQGLTPYRGITLIEERPKQINTHEVPKWKMFCIYNLHSGVKLLLFVQFAPSGSPLRPSVLLLTDLTLNYLLPDSTLDAHPVLLEV